MDITAKDLTDEHLGRGIVSDLGMGVIDELVKMKKGEVVIRLIVGHGGPREFETTGILFPDQVISFDDD